MADTTTLAGFLNRGRALLFIDRHQITEAGFAISDADWNAFRANPVLFLGSLDSQRAAIIWALTEPPKRAPYPFCRTPTECAGKGYCPKEIACND